jgi:predicted acetyltransferase
MRRSGRSSAAPWPSPGDITRFLWLWELLVRDPKWLREGDGPTFAVYEPEPGSLDGYVIWRVEPRWTGGLSDSLVRVRELIALTSQTEGALWRLVVEVADPLRPRNQGRFRLEAGQAGASCARTSADPDLVLDVAALGAAWPGGMRLASLARAGWVRQVRPGALARADAMLACDPVPWSTTIEVSIAKP